MQSTIECLYLDRVFSYKCLGFYFDNSLGWSVQRNLFKHITTKCTYGILSFYYHKTRNVYFAYDKSLIEGGIIA